jgi:hypothetical protein
MPLHCVHPPILRVGLPQQVDHYPGLTSMAGHRIDEVWFVAIRADSIDQLPGELIPGEPEQPVPL